jgi:hypothetical protein
MVHKRRGSEMAKSFFCLSAGMFLLVLSWHFGARSAGAQIPGQPTEIVVASGTLGDRQTIPLPRYADGTEALESECRWIISPHDLEFDQNIQHLHCTADHRLVRVYICHPNSGDSDNCANFQGTGWTADFLITAIRNSSPTATHFQSMGALKARYK